MLAAWLVALSRPAAAQLAPPAKCRPGAESALGGLACELRRAIAGTMTAPVVVGLSPRSTGAPKLEPALAVWLAVRLALELGGGAHAWPLAEQSERARALARGARPMLLVTPSLEGERLAVAVEVLGPKTSAPPSASDTIGRASAKRWLDAEVRRFLPPVTLAARKLERAGNLDGDVLALACGGASDAPTVASLGRQTLTLAPLEGNALAAPILRTRVMDLAEVAPVPLREPLASAWFTPEGELLLGSTDRAHGKRLGAEPGAKWRDLAARLPWPGGGCARLDGLLLAPAVVACNPGEAAPLAPKLADPLDAIAGMAIVSRNGATRLVRAGRRASDGAVMLSDGTREVRLEHAGAALALADMDGDGAPELVTSLDTADPSADALVVHSWLGTGLVERLRVPVPTGVRALAICPARAASMAPVVVASSGALWILP